MQIDRYDVRLEYRRPDSRCGYSWPPMVLALVLGTGLIVGIVGLSCGRLEGGIPLAGTCSAAVGAACCNAAGEEVGAERLPLRYGVLLEKSGGEDGRRYVGFSSREVEPLEDGVVYS